MPEPEPRTDREANEAVKRIERQLQLDRKLDKAYAAEGAGILLLPVLLAAAGLVGWALNAMGVDGPAMVFLGVPILLGLGVLAFRPSLRR